MAQFTGTVTYGQFANGSKSEGERPFLIMEDGSSMLLYKKNDNPFENKGMAAYDGKKVVLQGEIVKDVIEVDSVEEVQTAVTSTPLSTDPATNAANGTPGTTAPAADKEAE
jgi:hypothetical protein